MSWGGSRLCAVGTYTRSRCSGHPDPGVVARQAENLRAELPRPGFACLAASALTGAGLRLLRMFPLTCRSVDRRGMFLSRHTVKSQAISLDRQLGASVRSQAVARSRELMLLAGGERSFIPSGR